MPYFAYSPVGAAFGADTVYVRVFNDDVVTLTRGTPVYTHEAQGDTVSVKRAYNTSDDTSARTLGLVWQSIAPGAYGYVIEMGVLDKVSTGAYNEGDILYLGASPGTLTNVKPQAPNHMVYIGVVERANNGNGQILVKVQNGYELEELHNVKITEPVAEGDALVYDSVQDLWINGPVASGAFTAVPVSPDSVIETINRVIGIASSDTPATGAACLTMFTAEDGLTVGNVTLHTGSSTSSGLTLARMGLYTIDGSGNATLVARTASDTTLFNSSATAYTRAFSTVGGYPATYNLVKGNRYALGVICVGTSGGNYLSSLILSASTVIGSVISTTPRLAGNLNGQADLPTTISAGSFVNRGRLHYGRFTA